MGNEFSRISDMKVLLVSDVKSLGKRGDVLEVKNGYGLNFLLPEGLAVLATAAAIKGKDRVLAQFKLEEQAQAEELGALYEKLNGQTITIEAQAKDDKLFGSVGAKEICEALAGIEAHVALDMVELAKPLKVVGEYAVKIALGKQVAKITVKIAAL